MLYGAICAPPSVVSSLLSLPQRTCCASNLHRILDQGLLATIHANCFGCRDNCCQHRARSTVISTACRHGNTAARKAVQAVPHFFKRKSLATSHLGRCEVFPIIFVILFYSLFLLILLIFYNIINQLLRRIETWQPGLDCALRCSVNFDDSVAVSGIWQRCSLAKGDKLPLRLFSTRNPRWELRNSFHSKVALLRSHRRCYLIGIAHGVALLAMRGFPSILQRLCSDKPPNFLTEEDRLEQRYTVQ